MRQKMYKDDKRFAYVLRYIIADKKNVSHSQMV